MTPERIRKAVEVLAMIRQDIPADMKRIEGAPFTGSVVSEAFGRLGAQVDALAHVLQELLDDSKEGTQ